VTLGADELLAGSALTFEVTVPAAMLRPGTAPPSGTKGTEDTSTVVLRPLSVRDLQRITRAARDQDQLASVLSVERALVKPSLGVAQVASMHAGLAQFLLAKVMEISGLEVDAATLEATAAEPLAKAAFTLSEAFGWTPQEVQALTLGQVLLHLEMLKERAVG